MWCRCNVLQRHRLRLSKAILCYALDEDFLTQALTSIKCIVLSRTARPCRSAREEFDWRIDLAKGLHVRDLSRATVLWLAHKHLLRFKCKATPHPSPASPSAPGLFLHSIGQLGRMKTLITIQGLAVAFQLNIYHACSRMARARA